MSTTSTEPTTERATPALGLRQRFAGELWPLLVMALVFVAGRLLAQQLSPVAPYPDTASYSDVDFLGGAPRTWGVPLFWTLIPGGPTAEAYAQVLVGIAAWLFLASTVSRLCSTRLASVGGFGLVLALGLGVRATEWDMALLSESFSLSLLVALVALIMLAVDRLTPKRALALMLVLTWWTAARPGNASLLIALVVPLSIGLLLTRRRDVALWVVLPMLLITVWSGYASTREKVISVQNATGVIQDRFLPDPAAKEYLHGKGMPRSALVDSQVGVPYSGYDAPLGNDPAFRDWVIDRFQPAFLEYVVRHPSYAVSGPARQLPGFVTTRSEYTKAVVVLPGTLEVTLYPREFDLPFFLLAVLGLGLFALVRTRAYGRLLVPLFALAASGLWAGIIWHLGVRELVRLVSPAGMLLEIAMVLVVVMAIDVLLAARREPSPATVADEPATAV